MTPLHNLLITGCPDTRALGISGGAMEHWGAVVALLLAICALVRGATYTVTSQNCAGSGSFIEAVTLANLNPGVDTVTFTPGLVINGESCGFPSKKNPFAVTVNDSLIIEGNGVYFQGNLKWVSSGKCTLDVRTA